MLRLLEPQEMPQRPERLLYRVLLVFSVALDRDPAEHLDPVDRVVVVRVVVLDQADLGHIGHRVSIHRVLKKACVRVLGRTQRVRQWGRDLRDQRGRAVKRELKEIVRRDSIVGRDLIVDRVPIIVDRVRIADRVPKVPHLVIVRRDRKVQLVIARRASIVGRDLIVDRVPIIADPVLIIVDRDPKEARGLRKEGLPKQERRFRKPNPRPPNKLRSPQFRPPNRLHRQQSRPKVSSRSSRRLPRPVVVRASLPPNPL